MPHFSFDFGRDFLLVMGNFFRSFKIQTKYGTTASSLIISSIGLALIYVYKQKKNGKNNQRLFTRSMSIGALHGGKLAMARLLQYHEMRSNKEKQGEAVEKLEKMTKVDSPDFPQLQGIVAALEMTGQEDKAIEILEKTANEANTKSLLHHEYEYRMLLVEMLIYKGKLEEAEKAPCLNQEEASDVRRSLYKAIIQVLLNKTKKAEEEWQKFKKMRSQFLFPPDVKDSQFYELVTDFDKFKQVVDILGRDIDERKNAKD